MFSKKTVSDSFLTAAKGDMVPVNQLEKRLSLLAH